MAHPTPASAQMRSMIPVRPGGPGARAVVLLLAALVLALPAASAAPPTASARILHTVLQDDDLALYHPDGLNRFVNDLRWLGVDQLRVSAEWKLEAPSPNSRRPPRGFDPTDPNAYTGQGMRLLDLAVAAATRAGLTVIVDPAFSAPLWATGDPAPQSGVRDPWYNTNIDVRQAAAWEEMLARRYSGHYVPPGATVPLPRVDTFTLWNEPNEHGEVKPQWQNGIAVSADWERSLIALAYPAIKRVSPSATVLIGNTSDSGSDAQAGRGGVAPLVFIRRLACVDAQLRPISDGACAGFHTVPADGYAHHPYERDAPPWVPSGPGQAGWAQMGDLPRLQALLDRLVAMHRFAPGARNLWLTEQGYASNAQLHEMPWTEAQQAGLNAVSEYLAWRDPEVAAFSQFLLRDTLTSEVVALRARTGNPRAFIAGAWSTGLLREGFQPKPALWMFRAPVVARAVAAPGPDTAAGLSSPVAGEPARLLEVWGRARPARQPTVVQVQVSDGSGAYAPAGGAFTDVNGIFDVRVGLPGDAAALVRFSWLAPDGSWQASSAVSPFAAPGF